MKKKYTSILVFMLLWSAMTMAQEVQKNFINYQGVARNATNELMVNETMVLGIELKIGSAVASPVYSENHSIVTDSNGVFSLKIGNGDIVNGDYSAIPWGEQATYVTVLINDSEVGTTEMMAVPYALSSGDAKQSAAEVPYDNSGSGLTATNTQQAIDQLVGSGSVDDDADPTNEFQNLSFDATTNELSLSDGNSVTIPSGGTDADADPTNEFQNLSFDATTNELSLSDGNSITIPTGGTDADADPTNEIQDISLTGTELSISDGSTIDLAPIVPPGGSDDQNLELTGDVLSIESGTGSVDLSDYIDDNDADPNNEIQTISFDATTNEISLTDGGTITIPTGGTDADADPTNEIQDISLSGTELTISDGSTIDLAPIVPPGGSDDQNLELTGDVLSIEGGTGSVDLSTYRDDADADPTNEIQTLSFDSGTNELSLSDGNSIVIPSGGGESSGLEAINEGNGIGWRLKGRSPLEYANIGENAVDLSFSGFENSDVGASGSASTALGHYTTASGLSATAMGNGTEATGLYSTAMGIGSEASGYAATAMGTSTRASGRYATAMGQDTRAQAYGSTAIGRNNVGAGNPTTWSDTDPLFEVGNGSFSRRNNALTVLKNGNTGIGLSNPQTSLDIIGGQWDLNNTNGDFRIGNNSRGLRIGVATFGAGSGDVRLRAQGGTNRLFIGAGNEDVITVTPGTIAMNGDFVNQAMYQVSMPSFTPPASANNVYVDFPGATLTVDVPNGSKVLIGFQRSGLIDSDVIQMEILRDGNPIFWTRQDCYAVAGSREYWSFSMSQLDKNVTLGTHTYKVRIRHSDDAEDCRWWSDDDYSNTFYALILKE